MTKSEADIVQKLYIFKYASVPLVGDWTLAAAQKLADDSIVRIVEDEDGDLWAEPFELKETP